MCRNKSFSASNILLENVYNEFKKCILEQNNIKIKKYICNISKHDADMKNRMSDLKSARKITKTLKFLRYAYVFQKNHQNVHCACIAFLMPQPKGGSVS